MIQVNGRIRSANLGKIEANERNETTARNTGTYGFGRLRNAMNTEHPQPADDMDWRDPVCGMTVDKRPNRVQLSIAAVDLAHRFGLRLVDDEIFVVDTISQRRQPAHPHALLLQGNRVKRL
jgi:hypothetical protein